MRGPKLSVYPKGVLLETYRRRLIAVREEGFNDDFMAPLEEVHRQLEKHDSLQARLAEAERLLALAQFEHYCGPDLDCKSPFCVAMRAAGKPFTNDEFIAIRTADSADMSPYTRWKCPHCGWDNVDSVCFACKRPPGCDHLWSADDSDGVLLCLRCGHKEPK